MSKSQFLIVILLGVALAPHSCLAEVVADDGDAVAEARQNAEVRSLIDLDAAAVQRLRPLHRALREVLLAERVQLAQLHTDLAKKTTARDRLELQRGIRDVKIATEQALIRVQLEHARQEGREDDVNRLEQALDQMTDAATESMQPARERAQR